MFQKTSLILLFVLIIGFTSTIQNPFDFVPPPIVEYRLPTDAMPESYDISIKTQIHENIFEFSGNVTINFTAINPSSKIVLHKRDLRINLPIILTKITTNPIPFPLHDIQYDETNDFLTIFTEDYPTKKDDKFSMLISYSGELKTNGIGLYRTSYRNNDDGKERFENNSVKMKKLENRD